MDIDATRRQQYATGYALGIACRVAGRYLECGEDREIRNKWFGYCGWSDGMQGKAADVTSARRKP